MMNDEFFLIVPPQYKWALSTFFDGTKLRILKIILLLLRMIIKNFCLSQIDRKNFCFDL